MAASSIRFKTDIVSTDNPARFRAEVEKVMNRRAEDGWTYLGNVPGIGSSCLLFQMEVKASSKPKPAKTSQYASFG